jgi:hypothetical protein
MARGQIPVAQQEAELAQLEANNRERALTRDEADRLLWLIERSRARARLRRHRLPLLIEKTQRRLAQLQACAG